MAYEARPQFAEGQRFFSDLASGEVMEILQVGSFSYFGVWLHGDM